MSMWALMASPLFFSGDMGRLDEFTLNVLCNAEVIDVDQDALGKQARIVRQTEDEFVLAKPMEDGSLAVGLFNLTNSPRPMSVSWGDLGIQGTRKVRDAWRQKDLGSAVDQYRATVNGHGVALLRLGPGKAVIATHISRPRSETQLAGDRDAPLFRELGSRHLAEDRVRGRGVRRREHGVVERVLASARNWKSHPLRDAELLERREVPLVEAVGAEPARRTGKVRTLLTSAWPRRARKPALC